MEKILFVAYFAIATTIVNGTELNCTGIKRPERFFENQPVKRPAITYCEDLEFRYVTYGTPTLPDEFPYMSSIGWKSEEKNNTYEFKCGGVVIDLYHVLTAAHCAFVGGKRPDVVLPGGPNVTELLFTVEIDAVIVHPDYDPDYVYNDIALIRTKTKLFYEFACLWLSNELADNNVTIIGYGDTKFAGHGSLQLLKAELQAISNEECASYYDPTFRIDNGITRTQLCAKDPEGLRDTCQGDSGGPLLMFECRNNKLRAHVVGITSFGFGCGGEQPSVYTRISEYVEWIEGVIWPKS